MHAWPPTAVQQESDLAIAGELCEQAERDEEADQRMAEALAAQVAAAGNGARAGVKRRLCSPRLAASQLCAREATCGHLPVCNVVRSGWVRY